MDSRADPMSNITCMAPPGKCIRAKPSKQHDSNYRFRGKRKCSGCPHAFTFKKGDYTRGVYVPYVEENKIG